MVIEENTVAIIDYGYGNIFSVVGAIEKIGGKPLVLKTPDEAKESLPHVKKIILPGQGAYPACRQGVEAFLPYLLPAIKNSETQLLGICVGMQLLAEMGYEFEEVRGFGLVKGSIRGFADNPNFPQDLTLPQIAWNQITKKQSHPLLQNINDGDFLYFVHSYYLASADPKDILATTHYGIDYPVIIAKNNLAGIQCHPEKSQKTGLQFLKNFMLWRGSNHD